MTLLGCAQAKTVAPQTGVLQQQFHRTEAWAAIGVDPFTEPARASAVLGEDLLRFGILPIFITIHNSSTEPIVIRPANVSLSTPDGRNLIQVAPAMTRDPLQDRLRTAETVSGVAAVLVPISVVVLFPITESLHSDAVAVSQSVVKRALFDRILHPGESHHGFVYFRTTGSTFSETPLTLAIAVTTLETKTPFSTTFILPPITRQGRE
jgi:hypothetical protein